LLTLAVGLTITGVVTLGGILFFSFQTCFAYHYSFAAPYIMM